MRHSREGKADHLLMAVPGTDSTSKLSPCETLTFQPSQLTLGANNIDLKKILITMKLLVVADVP